MKKSKPVTITTSVYIESPQFLKFDITEEGVFLVLCGKKALIEKSKWLEFVHAVSYERGKEFIVDNSIYIDTKHKGMVYAKRYDSFAGYNIEDWQTITSKVTHLLK